MTSAGRPVALRNRMRPAATRPGPLGAATGSAADDPEPAAARAFHRSIPGYAATLLVDVPELADRWGVRSVRVKDESHRWGLPAFKILGASWAVNRALSARAGRPPAATLADLAGFAADGSLTLVTATDGNHGRALARMARLLGVAARIYLPGGLAAATADAIRSEGAQVIDTGELYDDAVTLAAESVSGGDVLIQDTAWDGYERVPGWIVDGYRTLFDEIDEISAGPAAAVAVPTGVGSLLQAALAHYRHAPTRVLAVEPVGAACVTASLATGAPVQVDTSRPTTMAGLNCGTVSRTAWPWIRDRLDAGIGVTDEEAARAAAILRRAGIPSGPCGAASAAGVDALLAEPAGRAALGLDASADLVLLSTEGPAPGTAPETKAKERRADGGPAR